MFSKLNVPEITVQKHPQSKFGIYGGIEWGLRGVQKSRKYPKLTVFGPSQISTPHTHWPQILPDDAFGQ